MSESPDGPDLAPEDERALASVLDEIIPPSADGRLPGAGALGLVADVQRAMQATPDLRPAVMQGLAALREAARRLGADAFPAVAPGERREVLNEVATSQPAFLPGLIFHTYVNYYQHPRVVVALGLEARPPHPQGYPLEPGDFGLLEPVRRRPPLYRDPEA